MTENKRYSEQNLENHLNRIYDNQEGKVIFDEDIVDLLNEQSDKITEQAIQIDFLRDENKHIRQVLEENRQLKQQLLYDGDVE